jgi:hypothetical protein
VILGVLTVNAHTGKIDLANGVATVGNANLKMHNPPMFLVGLRGIGMGTFIFRVCVLIPILPNAKGQAHQSHWGFFFCAIPLPDTIR